MKLSVIILIIAISGVTVAKTLNNSKKRSNSDYTKEELEGYEGYAGLVESTEVVAIKEVDNNGYSTGSELRSIAQGSASKANLAVVKQQAAAIQAAYVVQTTLAQTAIHAAATANAALVGKEVLLENLEKQSIDVIRTLDSEISQLEIAKKAAALAEESARLASGHVAVLTAALNGAQQSAEKADRAAQEAEANLASQTVMVGKSKGRFDSIGSKLIASQIDFEATKEAASKATAAAEEAHSNALNAGAHASAQLHEVADLSKGLSLIEH